MRDYDRDEQVSKYSQPDCMIFSNVSVDTGQVDRTR